MIVVMLVMLMMKKIGILNSFLIESVNFQLVLSALGKG